MPCWMPQAELDVGDMVRIVSGDSGTIDRFVSGYAVVKMDGGGLWEVRVVNELGVEAYTELQMEMMQMMLER